MAQMVVILLMTLSLGMGIANDGKDREPQNGWHSLIRYLLWFTLLYWGGFFDCF